MNLAEYLKRKREERGLSQNAFAKAIGYTRTAIFQIEKGRTISPSSQLLEAISKALDTPIENFHLAMKGIDPDTYTPPGGTKPEPEDLKREAMRALHRLPEKERLEVVNTVMQAFLQFTAQQLEDNDANPKK